MTSADRLRQEFPTSTEKPFLPYREEKPTICTSCSMVREGRCDGEKNLRSCKFYKKRVTNADRIRAMTDEELAKLLCDLIGCIDCPYWQKPDECGEERIGWLDWLKQEETEVLCTNVSTADAGA